VTRNISKINSAYFSHHLNPSNAKLNPTCHSLALLGAHHILHVSRIRVNLGVRITQAHYTLKSLVLKLTLQHLPCVTQNATYRSMPGINKMTKTKGIINGKAIPLQAWRALRVSGG